MQHPQGTSLVPQIGEVPTELSHDQKLSSDFEPIEGSLFKQVPLQATDPKGRFSQFKPFSPDELRWARVSHFHNRGSGGKVS